MSEITAERLVSYGDGEVSALAELERECFAGEAWSRDGIKSFLENKDVTTVVSLSDGVIVGCACAISVCDEAEILKVAVRSAYRRRGAARAMISELETLLRAKGVRRLLLEVRVGNRAARALYSSLGYGEYGVRRAYYTSPREDAVLMEKRV